jgi:DNA-binding NtrC family response regulator
MRILVSLPWKGNVRELDNVLERAMILGDGEWIRPADLPAQADKDLIPADDNLSMALDLFEKNHIGRVLAKVEGDKVRAAELMGLSLSTLYRKLEKLVIEA